MGRRMQGDPIGMSTCHDSGGNQAFMFSKTNEIRMKKHCLDAGHVGEPAILYDCHGQGGNQYWQYHSDVSRFLNAVHSVRALNLLTRVDQLQALAIKHRSGNCLTALEDATVTIHPCDGSPSQQWILHNLVPNID